MSLLKYDVIVYNLFQYTPVWSRKEMFFSVLKGFNDWEICQSHTCLVQGWLCLKSSFACVFVSASFWGAASGDGSGSGSQDPPGRRIKRMLARDSSPDTFLCDAPGGWLNIPVNKIHWRQWINHFNFMLHWIQQQQICWMHKNVLKENIFFFPDFVFKL